MENNLHIWIKHITEQELPIFSHTATAISQITRDDDSSPSELANAIMQDSTLTARILRVANSPLYNRSGQPISTISRAVMYIGFQRVRDISLSLSIIDSLLQHRTHSHALDLLARCFHAAVLARALGDKQSRYSAEEFFIASLLLNLGEMAFWCLSGPAGDKILQDLAQTGLPPEKAQYQVLGSTFNDITLHLNREWRLSELLSTVLEDHQHTLPQSKVIRLAHRIARLNQQRDDQRLKLEVVKQADELKFKLEDLNDLVIDSKAKAIEIATALGADVLTRRIEGQPEPVSSRRQPDGVKYPETDAILQLTSLRKLSINMHDQHNINSAIQIVLEGLHHGIGLDRASFILFDPANSAIRPKYCYGINCSELNKQLHIEDQDLLDSLRKEPHGLWIKPSNFLHADKYRDMTRRLQSSESFVCTICLNKQPIGVIYADRGPSGRPLNQVGYEGFLHFCQQAQLALNYICRDQVHAYEA